MENNEKLEKNMNIPANTGPVPEDQPSIVKDPEQVTAEQSPAVAEPLPEKHEKPAPPKEPTPPKVPEMPKVSEISKTPEPTKAPEAPQIPTEITPNMENIIPDLHPVHKKRMVVLMGITVVLGLVSVISLLFVLVTKGNDGLTLEIFKNEPMEKTEVEVEKKPEVIKETGEFDPVDIVNDLDNLDLEEIEKSYLDSGLN